MANSQISIRIIYAITSHTLVPVPIAKKMLVYLIVFLFASQVKGTNICDSGGLCVCRYKNLKNEDFVRTTIKCSYSEISGIIETNYTLPDVVSTLDLSSNNISVIKTSNLLTSKTLTELSLKNNDIKEIRGNVFQLPELKRLDLSDNALEFIDKETFRDIKKLEYLNLANNRFTTFAKLTFHPLSKLNDVILDNNAIGPVLHHTNLFDRSGFGLTNTIQSLSISGINLTKVPDNFFVDAYDLRKLTITNNNINEIFEIPFTLEYLDLSNNPIMDIAVEDLDLPGLKVLKLNNLQISEVPESMFASLKSLKVLELERNKNLTVFSNLAFGKNVLEDADDFVLERLSLKGSRLSQLDSVLMEPFSQLLELDLQGNPWTCDCNIVWVKKLQISERYYDHLRCANPAPLFNARIFDLKAKYFVCKNNHIGATIAVVAFCTLLSIVAVIIFICLPKSQSRCKLLRNMYAPSTAYSVLPMSARWQSDRNINNS